MEAFWIHFYYYYYYFFFFLEIREKESYYIIIYRYYVHHRSCRFMMGICQASIYYISYIGPTPRRAAVSTQYTVIVRQQSAVRRMIFGKDDVVCGAL